MIKIDTETAERDYKKFVETLNLSDLKLAKLEEEKGALVQLIEYGYLEIGEEIVYNLEVPFAKGQEMVTTLIFKNRRFTLDEVDKYTAGSKSDIETSRRLLSALVCTNSALLKGLDSEDFVNLGKISAFFLPR